MNITYVRPSDLLPDTNNTSGLLMADSSYSCFGVDDVCRYVRIPETPVDRRDFLQTVIDDLHCRYDDTLRRLSG